MSHLEHRVGREGHGALDRLGIPPWAVVAQARRCRMSHCIASHRSASHPSRQASKQQQKERDQLHGSVRAIPPHRLPSLDMDVAPASAVPQWPVAVNDGGQLVGGALEGRVSSAPRRWYADQAAWKIRSAALYHGVLLSCLCSPSLDVVLGSKSPAARPRRPIPPTHPHARPHMHMFDGLSGAFIGLPTRLHCLSEVPWLSPNALGSLVQQLGCAASHRIALHLRQRATVAVAVTVAGNKHFGHGHSQVNACAGSSRRSSCHVLSRSPPLRRLPFARLLAGFDFGVDLALSWYRLPLCRARIPIGLGG